MSVGQYALDGSGAAIAFCAALAMRFSVVEVHVDYENRAEARRIVRKECSERSVALRGAPSFDSSRLSAQPRRATSTTGDCAMRFEAY